VLGKQNLLQLGCAQAAFSLQGLELRGVLFDGVLKAVGIDGSLMDRDIVRDVNFCDNVAGNAINLSQRSILSLLWSGGAF
jgi:hypothetical protein